MNFDTTENLTIVENPQIVDTQPLIRQFKEYPARAEEKPKLRSDLTVLQPVPQTAVTVKPQTPQNVLPAFFIPGVAKLFLLIPAVLTTLYARSYSGEYQLFINNQVVYIMYAVTGSLFFSLILFWQKPWKPVLISSGILVFLNLVHALTLYADGAAMKHNVFNILFGRSFNPADFIFYAVGAAISFLILLAIHTNQPEPRTEVY